MDEIEMEKGAVVCIDCSSTIDSEAVVSVARESHAVELYSCGVCGTRMAIWREPGRRNFASSRNRERAIVWK